LRRRRQLPNDGRPLRRDDDLAAAFSDADAVVHLAGTFSHASRTPTEPPSSTPPAALTGSPARRLVFLSFLTARLDASNS
jgi:hypothetical protein